jgi:hypothetical protein
LPKSCDVACLADHADVRPTILALTGLKDDYSHDGGLTMQMARVYKQINAPVGQLGLASLDISTRALESNDL